MHIRFSCLCLSLLAVLALTGMRQSAAAPRALPWPFWQASDASRATPIDHQAWQAILDRYLIVRHPSGINRFRYAAVTRADRARLAGYIERLQSLDPRRYRRVAQAAYWINLYNALTVRVVLDHYPVDSIRDIRSGFFSPGPWDMKLLHIAGQALSLNDIEHRILRPIWRDPRIHFAVNCASLGCPNLAPVAYSGADLESQLDRAAREFIGHPRGLHFAGDSLVVSTLFKWYRSDFAVDEAGLRDYLARYAPVELALRLQGYRGRIRYRYDWALNRP